ncbi:MAG: 30S ribosomal protein S12 methylthiotransferase RimO [Magnetospiraceae bacterium]
MSTAAPKVGLVSLGCPKALVDSEALVTRLKAQGYDFAEGYEDADVVLVNTCGFLDSAKAESLSAIEEALKENGRVVVTGCMGGDAGAILDKFPDVLSVSGPRQFDTVVTAIGKAAPVRRNPGQLPVPGAGVRLTPSHYAYLKISEGCNHSCTFCIIPDLRGKLVSRPAATVLEEAENLVEQGVRELLVISQDTSAYGVDIKHQTSDWHGTPVRAHMTDLSAALAELGVWVRLHYVYPYPHVDQVLPLMASDGVLPYMDIPFQHASPSVLKAMRRPAHAEKTLERIADWRTQCPDLVLRSTFVVGFPGETDADFETLLHWIKEARLDRVGCFKYEPVAGAQANALPGAVPDDVKQARWDALMETQQAISAEKLAARVGQTLDVLIDAADETGAVGRSYADAPDIDGVVYLPDGAGLQPGDLTRATITKADAYDLWGAPPDDFDF